MDINSIFKHFIWVLIIIFDVCNRLSFSYYRQRQYMSYPYERAYEPSEDSYPGYYDYHREYDIPRPAISKGLPRIEYKWSDYDYDVIDYTQPKRQRRVTGIASFSSDAKDEHTLQNFMLKVKDLEDLPAGPNTKGHGNKRDPHSEEMVKESMGPGPRPRRATGVRSNEKKDALGQSLSTADCGETSDLGMRIVGGQDAIAGAHPWIAAILKDGEAWCGGTIINKDWILTAAHCFMGDEPEQSTWAIRVGTLNRNQGRTYKIKKVIAHQRFNLDNMLNSDIALMKVAKPIEFSTTVHAVCLPPNSYDEPRTPKIKIAGWGATKFDNEDLPVMLQDVALTVIKDSDCAKKYRQKKYTLYKSQFCSWNFKKDACQGDSGGPAIELVDGKAYLAGVVSYGSTCADDFPGVYTQVSYFLKWISETMKNNS